MDSPAVRGWFFGAMLVVLSAPAGPAWASFPGGNGADRLRVDVRQQVHGLAYQHPHRQSAQWEGTRTAGLSPTDRRTRNVVPGLSGLGPSVLARWRQDRIPDRSVRIPAG
jgi:hypothetical protein